MPNEKNRSDKGLHALKGGGQCEPILQTLNSTFILKPKMAPSLAMTNSDPVQAG